MTSSIIILICVLASLYVQGPVYVTKQSLVPSQSADPPEHCCKRHFDLHLVEYVKKIIMSQPADLEATLIPEDLIRLLMHQCYELIKEEREHTNIKIKKVFESLPMYTQGIVDGLNQISTNHEQKLTDLDLKTEKNIADVNLKVETISIYQEQLLFNLKTGLQSSLEKVEKDMKLLASQIFACNICGYNFANQQHLQQHIQAYHGTVLIHSCQVCGNPPKTRQLNDHRRDHMPCNDCYECGYTMYPERSPCDHTQPDHVLTEPIDCSTTIHCKFCERTFRSMVELNIHTQENHVSPTSVISLPSTDETEPPIDFHPIINPEFDIPQYDGNNTIEDSDGSETVDHEFDPDQDNRPGSMSISAQCDKCDKTFFSRPDLNKHIQHEHGLERPLPYQVAQFDVNLSLPDTEPVNRSSGTIPATFIRSSPTSSEIQKLPNMQYSYILNQAEQSKRLLGNTERPSYAIRQNNFQTIGGRKHPTSVSMDFNSGVYLSAVKPALQTISDGWSTTVLSTLIECKEVSDRREMSGRKVCTKLVLILTEKKSSEKQGKVVVHFYHTSNTLQVQG